jgi:hypothetical protein
LTDADRAALQRRYPATRPPTITTPRHLPPPVSSPYQVQLQAMGGSGDFTWSVGMFIQDGTLVQDELPYWLSLSPTGLLAGYPGPYSSTSNFFITATDAHGDSHTKVFLYPGGGRESVATTTSTTTTTTLGDRPTGYVFPCVPPTTVVVTLPVVTTTTATATTLVPLPCAAESACAEADCLLVTELAGVEAALPRTAGRTARALKRFHGASREAVASLTVGRGKRARMLASRVVHLSATLGRLLRRARERSKLGEPLSDRIDGLVVAVRDAVGQCVTPFP